jgi:hypothetical protein
MVNVSFARCKIHAATMEVLCVLIAGVDGNRLKSLLDDCGMRFLISAQHYIYLLKTIPITQRTQLQKSGLCSAHYVWAFHSDYQQVTLHSQHTVISGNS